MTWWMRLLVRLYPRSWRQRYGAELEALIEDSGADLRSAVDVARGAALMQFAYGMGAVRQHARGLAGSPAFSVTAVLTLAAGLGANALIFTLLYTALLKPLPFEQPDRLVALSHVAPGLTAGRVNQAAFTYFTYREEARSLEDIGLWTARAASVTTPRGYPEEVPALAVTDGTLPLLRVAPVLGRTFTAEDDAPGSAATVMLSRTYWLRAFGGNPAAVGQSLVVDGQPREVIGVLPDGFTLLDHTPDLVLPLRLNRAAVQVGLFRYEGVARLAAGVDAARAQSDLARLVPGMPDRFPIPRGFTREMYDAFQMVPVVRPLHEEQVGDASGTLWILFGAAGLLLLVACVNVANLFIVRGDARRQEVAVQLALGAPLRRVAGQTVGEALLLSVAGGVGALFIADAGLALLRSFGPNRLPRLQDAAIDPPVVMFVLLMSIVAGVIFGVAPLVRYRRLDIAAALRAGGRGASDGRDRQRLRNVLVAAQVAITVVLLVSSALMVRTFLAIQGVQTGVGDPGRLLTVRLTIPEAVLSDPAATARAHHAIHERVAALRGVESAAVVSSVTMDGANRRDPLFVEGRAISDGQMPPVRRMKWAGPGYFATIGNGVRMGRDFTWEDVLEHRPVAVVNETLARTMFGTASAALGQRVRTSATSPWREIVGVSGDERDDGPTRPVPAIVYWPFMQQGMAPDRVTVERTLVYTLRTTRADDPGLLAEIQQSVWAVAPSVPLSRVETLQDVMDRVTSQTSLTMLMLALASAVTLLLSMVGLYGVIAYVVAQRRREVAIRLALGATGGTVQRLFLRRGLALVAVGLAIGTAGAVVATRALNAMLFEVTTLDPLAYVAASAVLCPIAALAIWLPARAATRLGLVTALRG